MKTVGERIRQARNAHAMSGEALARRVGYKNQSAISNLENRAGGTGGNKIGAIAEALRVPLSWLMYGPDEDNIPFLPGLAPVHLPDTPFHTPARAEKETAAPIFDSTQYDIWTTEALILMLKLQPHQRQGALAALRTHVQHLAPPSHGQNLPLAA